MTTPKRKNSDVTVIEQPEMAESDKTDPGSEAVRDAEPEADDLASVLAELGGDANAQVSVSRIVKQTGKREFVNTYPAAEFSLTDLQANYGGGEYIILGRKRNRISFNRRVAIAEPVKRPEQPGAADGSLAAVLENGLRQQTEQINKLMMMMIGMKSAGGQADPDALRRGLLQDMVQMKELVAGSAPADGGMGPAQVIELLKTGMDIGRDSAGGTGPLDVMARALETFGKPVAAALAREQQRQEQAAGQDRPVKRPGAAPGQVPPAAAARQDNEGEAAMRQHLAFLCEQAASGSDPMLWADVILDQVPEKQLRAFLGQPDPVSWLGKLDNKVLIYREWFTALGSELKTQLGIVPAGGVSESSASVSDQAISQESSGKDQDHSDV